MTLDVAMECLLETLRAREVPISRDDVQWAFSVKNSRQEAVDFVDRYLTAETLLSRNELELYQRLERNGTARDLAANHDLSLVRPILDDEIQTAVKSLEASTLAIEGQAEALKSQRVALSAFQEQGKQTKVRGEARNGQRHRKQEQEMQHVELAVDELFHKVATELETCRHRLRAGTAMIPTILAEQLKRDHRLLSKLSKLGIGLTGFNDVDRETMDRSLTLCKALATYDAEGIRCRLDRIYMEASRSLSKEWISSDDIDLCSSVREEMSSLYSEIAAVAEMSINCEFESPLFGHFRLKQGKDGEYGALVLDFLDATVSHLHRRADHYTTIIRTHQSHQMTVQVLCDEVNGIDLHQPHDQMRTPAKVLMPDFDQSVQLLPPRVSSSISSETSKSDSVSKSTLSSSLAELLGLLGFSSRVDSGSEQLQNIFGVATSDREQTIWEHSSSRDLGDTLLLAQIRNAAETNQLLADVLYTDSPDGRFSLVDKGIERRTLMLESAIDGIGGCLAGLDLDVLQQTNGIKDGFVNRWAV